MSQTTEEPGAVLASMDPMDEFEHQLVLSSFCLASHSLRLLSNAGLLDEDARAIIRKNLVMLQEKVDAIPDGLCLGVQVHLDTLTAVLPPSTSAGGSPTAAG